MTARNSILVADDDEELLDLLEFYLSRRGYDVHLASDGRQALVKAQEQKFDLVLLDVMMPVMDGYHVASELSARMSSGCPKIVLTKPATQCPYGILAKWGATFLAALASTADMSTIAEQNVLQAQADELRNHKAGLNYHKQECPVPTTCENRC